MLHFQNLHLKVQRSTFPCTGNGSAELEPSEKILDVEKLGIISSMLVIWFSDWTKKDAGKVDELNSSSLLTNVGYTTLKLKSEVNEMISTSTVL